MSAITAELDEQKMLNFLFGILFRGFFFGIGRAGILTASRDESHQYNEYNKLFHLFQNFG